MITDIAKTKHHVLHACLAMLAGIFTLAGCGIQVNSDRLDIPASTRTPALAATPLPAATSTPQPAATVPEISLEPSVTPSATALSSDMPISDDELQGLFSSQAMTMSQFTMQYPAEGFFKAPARKQMGTAAATQNPFLALFPELREMAAPTWLKEGTRVTYHMMSSTRVQKPKTGLKDSSGEGYNQYDLVALEDGAAVSSLSVFSNLGNAILPLMVMRSVDLPGAGEYWINPDVLKEAERVASDDLAVYHTPYKLGNKTYNATRFEYKSDDAEYVWVFDEDSGLMLFYRNNIGSDDSDTRQVAIVTLVRQRQLKLPWRPNAKAKIPAWAKVGAKLNYEGAYTLILADGSSTPLTLNVLAQIVDRNQRWLDWQLKTTMQYQTPGTTNRASGMVQPFDAYWLPAEAIKSLKNGQVIDRDPVTGAKITASRGQGVVSLTESNGSFNSVLTYDTKTGALVSVQQDTSSGAGTIRIELQLTSQ